MDNSIVFDWVSLSGHFLSMSSMFEFIGIDGSYLDGKFLPCPGRNFFDYGMCYISEGKQAITFLYSQHNNGNDSVDSPETLGMIDLSGRGCRLFETYSKLSFLELFERIYKLDNFQVCRLDIALDIKDKDYPMSRFINAYRKHNYICAARSQSHIESRNAELEGHSLYFGTQASDFRINIYDKRAERGFTERELPDGWIRIEVRLRHQTAMVFLERFINGVPIGQLYFGVLTDKLRFLTPSKTDSNKHRWATAKWWLKIIQDNESIHLEMPGITYDFSRWEKNFWTQCGSRLKLFTSMYPNPWDLYAEINSHDIQLNSDQRFLKDNYIPGVAWYEVPRAVGS